MSSQSRQRRKAAKKAKKEKEWKKEFQKIGLPWIEDEDLRKECVGAGMTASLETWVAMSPSVGEQLKAFVKGISDPISLVKHIRKMNKGTPAQRAASDAAFDAAYLQCFNRRRGTASPEASKQTEAPAPRKQIDFGTVGSTLPPQSVAMMAPKTSAMPPWVLPAFGLVAVAYVWSASK